MHIIYKKGRFLKPFINIFDCVSEDINIFINFTLAILYMSDEKSAFKSLMEGLILIASILVALAVVNASASPSLNYEIIPDSQSLTLQQNSNYRLNLHFKLYADEKLDFILSSYSSKSDISNSNISNNNSSNNNIISTYINSRYSSSYDFTLPLLINVSDIDSGDYTVYVSSKVYYGGILNEKILPIKVKVIPKEKYVFSTTNYTNELPELELENISTRNLLISKAEKQNIVFKFKNYGSASTFFINYVIESEDKNKVYVMPNQKYFYLDKDEEKNIVVDVSLDKDYNFLFSRIYFYAQENTTNKQLDLGYVNLTLKTQSLILDYSKDTNYLEIVNNGTDISTINIETDKRNTSFVLMPNQKYITLINSDESYANVLLNGQAYKQLYFKNTEETEEKKLTTALSTSITGLFSFGQGNYGWVILIVVVVLLYALIRKLFFSKKAIFGNNVYVKDLKLN